MFDITANKAPPARADTTRVDNTIHSSISNNGIQTITSLLITPQLEISPLIVLISPMINKAFSHAIATVNEFGPEALIFVARTPIDNEEALQAFTTVSAKRSTGEVFDPEVDLGLAGKVMSVVEEEIKRRTTGNGKEVQIVLTTAKEHNEKFYSKRGYIVTGETKTEAGMHGSLKGFAILQMMKRL
ncbi:hypothetical protein MMC11_009014 [Xylographa trunciseda]|nr:hypothetical protein [Xylographa trunciseda]